jgi:hypothetical protein
VRRRAPLSARFFGGLMIVAGLYVIGAGAAAHNLGVAGFGAAGVVLGMWVRRPQ